MPKHPGFPSLSGLSVKAQPPSQHPSDAALLPLADPPEADLIEAGKGTTVHLTKHAARELKTLAAQEDTTVQALMIEGINLVFKKHGMPEIAAVGVRPDAARKKAAKQARAKAS